VWSRRQGVLDLYGTSSTLHFGLAFLTTDPDEWSGADEGRSRSADNLFVNFRDRSSTTIIGRTSKGVSMVTAGVCRCFWQILDVDFELLSSRWKAALAWRSVTM
jgi:hypothetical protein